MKKGVLGLLPLFLIQLVSAQFFSGYGRFSLSGFFSSVNPENLILTSIFLIVFLFIFYALTRFFRGRRGEPNKAIAGTVAFAISLLIVYGFYRTGLDLSGIFYGIGISQDLLYGIIGVVILIVAILLIGRIGFSWFLIIAGFLLIAVTIFTEIFYSEGFAFALGVVLIVIGWALKKMARRREGGAGLGGSGGAPRGTGARPRWGRRRNNLNRGRIRRKKKAERIAYGEDTKRTAYNRRVIAHQTRQLQQIYDRQKQIYEDPASPKPARSTAAKEMKNLMNHANRNGLNLRP